MPNSKHHLERIKKSLKPFLKPGQINECQVILAGQKPTDEAESYTEGRACRIILGVSGTGRFLTIENKKEATYEINRGDCLFLGPNTWITCVPRVTYKSLGIIFGQSFLRLTITRRTVKKEEVHFEYLAKWSDNRTLHIRENYVLQLLQQPEPATQGTAYFRYLLEIILNQTWELLVENKAYRPAQGNALWQAFCEYIMEHWSEPDLSRERLADHFHVHPNHVSRIFKSYGKTKYISFLNEVRLSRSTEFLISSNYSITDIAALCGYTDLQYYIKCFRERYGVTPGEFRRNRGCEGGG